LGDEHDRQDGLTEPFRSPDLAAHIESLRVRRAELQAELALIRYDIRAQRPWSWSRFLLGLAVLPGVFMLLTLVVALVAR
jgi:hypothetical protein